MITSITKLLCNRIKAVVKINDTFVTVELSSEEIKDFEQLIINKAKKQLEKRKGNYSFNKTNGNLDFN